MGRLRYLWSNGHRPLVLAALYFLGSLVLLAAALGYAHAVGGGSWDPIYFRTSIQIENRVDGYIGPAARVGQTINFHYEVCNRENRPVYATVEVDYRSPATQATYWAKSLCTVIDPGCTDMVALTSLPPADVVVGEWRYELTYISLRGDDVQKAVLSSEIFKVVD
jgi:hypothetical protein